MMFGNAGAGFYDGAEMAAGFWGGGAPMNLGAADGVAGAPVAGKTTFKRRKHIHTERQRRIYMSTLLESLQSLLPDPRPRKDRCTLLSEVIAYLRSLEDTVKDLAKRKEEIAATSHQCRLVVKRRSKRVRVNQDEVKATNQQPCLKNLQVQEMLKVVDSNTTNPNTKDVVITFLSSHIRGIWSEILLLLHRHQIEVVNVTFSTTPTSQKLHYIHARVPEELGFQCDDLKSLFAALIES